MADKKSEAQLKTLDKAQTVLLKYQFDPQSLTEKDWGNVIRWVLPEAKIEFLLKDLKKKDQILASPLTYLAERWSFLSSQQHQCNTMILYQQIDRFVCIQYPVNEDFLQAGLRLRQERKKLLVTLMEN